MVGVSYIAKNLWTSPSLVFPILYIQMAECRQDIGLFVALLLKMFVTWRFEKIHFDIFKEN